MKYDSSNENPKNSYIPSSHHTSHRQTAKPQIERSRRGFARDRLVIPQFRFVEAGNKIKSLLKGKWNGLISNSNHVEFYSTRLQWTGHLMFGGHNEALVFRFAGENALYVNSNTVVCWEGCEWRGGQRFCIGSEIKTKFHAVCTSTTDRRSIWRWTHNNNNTWYTLGPGSLTLWWIRAMKINRYPTVIEYCIVMINTNHIAENSKLKNNVRLSCYV